MALEAQVLLLIVAGMGLFVTLFGLGVSRKGLRKVIIVASGLVAVAIVAVVAWAPDLSLAPAMREAISRAGATLFCVTWLLILVLGYDSGVDP